MSAPLLILRVRNHENYKTCGNFIVREKLKKDYPSELYCYYYLSDTPTIIEIKITHF